MNDHDMIERCKKGDSEALGELYDEYREHLLILAIALVGCMDEAEDVLHDMFVNFVERLMAFRLTGSLKGYLSICVANQARNHRKRTAYRVAVNLDEAKTMVSGKASPAQVAISNEYVQLLGTAMSRLPMEQREAVALHLHCEMPFREIARQIEIPVSTVKSRYRYGISKLRSILNREVAS